MKRAGKVGRRGDRGATGDERVWIYDWRGRGTEWACGRGRELVPMTLRWGVDTSGGVGGRSCAIDEWKRGAGGRLGAKWTSINLRFVLFKDGTSHQRRVSSIHPPGGRGGRRCSGSGDRGSKCAEAHGEQVEHGGRDAQGLSERRDGAHGGKGVSAGGGEGGGWVDGREAEG